MSTSPQNGVKIFSTGFCFILLYTVHAFIIKLKTFGKSKKFEFGMCPKFAMVDFQSKLKASIIQKYGEKSAEFVL